jgi:hypothetical protein
MFTWRCELSRGMVMTAVSIGRSIMQALYFATGIIGFIFVNFLLRRADSTVLGVQLPTQKIHAVLGPALVLLNAYLFVLLCELYKIRTSSTEITELQRLQKYKILGPIFNPFYASGGVFANAVGYAFLIAVVAWHVLVSIFYRPKQTR